MRRSKVQDRIRIKSVELLSDDWAKVTKTTFDYRRNDGTLLAAYAPVDGEDDALWRSDAAPNLVIDEVERIWSAIDAQDDWSAFEEKIGAIRALGSALGEAPAPAGHRS